MHFISGGAFNGKKKAVKNRLLGEYEWYSAYKQDSFPTSNDVQANCVVIEGLERYFYEWSKKQTSIDDIRYRFSELATEWRHWEAQENNRQVYWIGTDITKGIVPLQALDRKTRDVTGYCYQDLVKLCTDVTVVWFGLLKTMKEGK
ncbi:bifunctional adenosylcobinamide kinase/adenosylcobinamide-phosphate guanylyltransferase [Massilibacterium senegalense]|uniref:bifunctional adenosylcobinamide kinase/adenosylcobinamide-phosphate guanylyltransferase n=1 Tax=Massilibacterium senegalense TaxID=1632858 RepID=UPI000781CF0C|nr:bifunctional adenosylcobinamide kinase/adenosylcobinamide-phosphate guanylyltransferase [Massilibacterium senegalense]